MNEKIINSEMLTRVRQIHIKSKKLVSNLMGGEYLSAFKGQGMEFNEVREYQPGDDVRSIDWNVTARTGTPYIKGYVEERELTVVLMVDISGSVYFGTTESFKRDAIAEAAAVFALTAMSNNDKVGLMLFDDSSRKYIPPSKGRGFVLRLIQEILSVESSGRETNIAATLDTFNKVQKKGSVVFLISDFMSADFSQSLRRTSRRHDLICINIRDRIETSLLSLGLVELADAESGETCIVDFNNKKTREAYELQVHKNTEALNVEFLKAKCEVVHLMAHEDILDPLHKFFRQRERRLSHYA